MLKTIMYFQRNSVLFYSVSMLCIPKNASAIIDLMLNNIQKLEINPDEIVTAIDNVKSLIGVSVKGN